MSSLIVDYCCFITTKSRIHVIHSVLYPSKTYLALKNSIIRAISKAQFCDNAENKEHMPTFLLGRWSITNRKIKLKKTAAVHHHKHSFMKGVSSHIFHITILEFHSAGNHFTAQTMQRMLQAKIHFYKRLWLLLLFEVFS